MHYNPLPKTLLLLTILLLLPATAISQSNDFVVHEWGTFTSIAGSNGEFASWRPLNDSSDLPSFVYKITDAQSCKICTWAQVRMETPVLYFYSDHEVEASVTVDFPKGKITEWFPKAKVGNTFIDWGKIRINPKAEIYYQQEAKESHYYPARETDAAPIAIQNGQKAEYEKFLFYRGVGNFDLPLSVQLSKNQIKIKSTIAAQLGTVFLIENKAGKIGFQAIHLSGKETVTERPALTQSVTTVFSELEKSLIAQGLYPREAQAMIKTWRDSWFEEGLRIFYLTPTADTEQILPLTITPKPTKIVRVLVGRLEILRPEFIQKIQNLASHLVDDPTAENEIRRQGRFADVIIQELRDHVTDEQLKAKLYQLSQVMEK